MHVPAVVAVGILATAGLAGCLAGQPDATPPDPDRPAAPILYDGFPPGVADPFLAHSFDEHKDPTLHDMAFNMSLAYHHPLGGNAVRSSGAHVVDVRGDWLFVGTYGAAVDVQGGVWIFNIEDPRAPELVGEFHLPGNLGGDRSLEATEDGDYLVLGTEAIDCAGHVNPFAPGLYLIDATDKSAPRIVDYEPDAGVHSVTVHRIDGDDYVFAVMGGPNVYRILRDGPVAQLALVGNVAIGHDSTVYDDPILGKPLLLAAGGGGPLTVYDVSDPADAQQLGQWNLEDRRAEPAYFHAVEPYVVGDQRFLAMDSEDWDGDPSPLWVLDATDLEDMQLVGTWANPGGHPADAGAQDTESLAFSTHNPRIEDGVVYMAHYHAGVWMLDISSEAKRANPQIVGYYLPHEDTGLRPASSHGAYPAPNICNFPLTEIPNVFDLEVQDGVVYAADLHTGLYVLVSDDA